MSESPRCAQGMIPYGVACLVNRLPRPRNPAVELEDKAPHMVLHRSVGPWYTGGGAARSSVCVENKGTGHRSSVSPRSRRQSGLFSLGSDNRT